MSTEKLKVTAIVYSAKGLKPKKRERHRFGVIIGVGGNKYRTDVIEDLFGNPIFNTECEIEVDDPSQPLLFVVTEKSDKDILGQVSVSLCDLVNFRTNRPVRLALQPHKKCLQPTGELQYEAWISAGTVSSSLTAMMDQIDGEEHRVSFPAGLRKLKDKLTASPMLSRKSSGGKGHKRTGSDGLFPLKPNSSMSCHDLTSLSTLSTHSPQQRHSSACRSNSITTADTESLSSVDSGALAVLQESNKPEVTGVSPKEGPTEGGTRLTIRGSNLGLNKEDVVGLYVCGSNILASLEYFSSSKLVCTTKAHRPGSGTIAVETQVGGRGVSLVQFTFLSPAVPAGENSDSLSEASSSLSRSSSRGDADVRRDTSLKGESDRPSLKSNLNSKARSMFDLSVPTKPLSMSPVLTPNRPEVTGISPREGLSSGSTRVVIRGSNLGLSVGDVASLTVSGVDCTSTLEYTSPTRLSCVAGPSPGGATVGDVIVETKSGGVGSSTVQFRYVDAVPEDDQWAAVPYDIGESHSDVTVTPAAPPPPPVSSTEDATIVSPFQRVRQPPPPIVEIQPMSRQQVTRSQSGHRKNPAPPPPPPSVTLDNPADFLRQSTGDGDRVTDSSFDVGVTLRSSTDESLLNEKVAEMSSNLALTQEMVKKLQLENRLLRDENERMRQYMECLVSKAITDCPQILCVDTSKLF